MKNRDESDNKTTRISNGVYSTVSGVYRHGVSIHALSSQQAYISRKRHGPVQRLKCTYPEQYYDIKT